MVAVPRRALVGLALPPALTLALSVASCRDADPARLQANVRLAAPSGRGLSGPAPAAAARRPAGDRIDELLAAVAAGREADGLPARIEAVLRRDDDAVRAALAFMRAEKATKLVIDALAAAATPAAQQALCDLARDRRLTPNVRAGAVASLGLLRRPTAATMTAVAELTRADADARAEADDERAVGPALFLAGSLARAGRVDHPTEAAALEKLVLARSARARSSAELVESLAALGNLGSAAVLPRLRAALAAGDPACAPRARARCVWFPTRRPIGCWPRHCAATTTRPCALRPYSRRDSESSGRWSMPWWRRRRTIRASPSAAARSPCWCASGTSSQGADRRRQAPGSLTVARKENHLRCAIVCLLFRSQSTPNLPMHTRG